MYQNRRLLEIIKFHVALSASNQVTDQNGRSCGLQKPKMVRMGIWWSSRISEQNHFIKYKPPCCSCASRTFSVQYGIWLRLKPTSPLQRPFLYRRRATCPQCSKYLVLPSESEWSYCPDASHKVSAVKGEIIENMKR